MHCLLTCGIRCKAPPAGLRELVYILHTRRQHSFRFLHGLPEETPKGMDGLGLGLRGTGLEHGVHPVIYGPKSPPISQ